jgi:hypothetical protein
MSEPISDEAQRIGYKELSALGFPCGHFVQPLITDLATLRRKLDGLQKERDELSKTIEGAHHDAMIDWPGSEVPLLGQVESLFSALRNLFNTKYAEALRVAGELTKEIRTIMAIAPDDRANPGCECQRCRIIRALTDAAAGLEGKEL